MTAEALSITDRDWRVERPPACRARWACTVDSRSSIRRTGTPVRSARAARPFPGRGGCGALLPAHVQGQADVDLDGLPLVDDRAHARERVSPAGDGVQGHGQHPERVAARDADPDRADIAGDADSGPHRATAPSARGSWPRRPRTPPSIPAALVPPPWANSSLPPPRPSMLGAAACRTAFAVMPEGDGLGRRPRHDGDLAVRDRGADDDDRDVVTGTALRLDEELAEVVRRGALRRDEVPHAHRADVLALADDAVEVRGQLRAAHLGEVALGRLEGRDRLLDALDELVGRRLHQLRQAR